MYSKNTTYMKIPRFSSSYKPWDTFDKIIRVVFIRKNKNANNK